MQALLIVIVLYMQARTEEEVETLGLAFSMGLTP
jgi:hypothetical protein